jgi:pilus assembly protein CpaE
VIYSVVVITHDQAHAHRLRTLLDEVEELELVDLVADSAGALDAVSRRECHILLVDEAVGPIPAIDVIRDVSSRIPYVATMLMSSVASPQQLEAVVDSGGRGMIALDEPFEDLRRRLLAAGEWSLKVRGIKAELGGLSATSCLVLTFVGAKGGVGTTLIALHTARVAQQRLRVCLLDLDSMASDLASYTAVAPRRDLADLAALGTSLSVQAVQEVVFADATGLNILCAPADPERGEDIDAALVRSLLILLRQMYDVVVVDAGSAVTDTTATVLELADEVVVVTTPDMPAIRGARRVIDACQRLGLRDSSAMRVLVNRVDPRRQLQPANLPRMLAGSVLSSGIPAVFSALEDGINLADPALVRDRGWHRAINAIWAELAPQPNLPLPRRDGPPSSSAPVPSQTAGRRRRGRRKRSAGSTSPGDTLVEAPDAGVVTVEFLVLMPFVLLLFMACLQLVCYVAAEDQATKAAGAAAHALARGDDPTAAGRAEETTTFSGHLVVSAQDSAGGVVHVTVRVDVPSILPSGWLPSSFTEVSATAGAVNER